MVCSTKSLLCDSWHFQHCIRPQIDSEALSFRATSETTVHISSMHLCIRIMGKRMGCLFCKWEKLREISEPLRDKTLTTGLWNDISLSWGRFRHHVQKPLSNNHVNAGNHITCHATSHKDTCSVQLKSYQMIVMMISVQKPSTSAVILAT